MNYLIVNHLKKSFDELGVIKGISPAAEERGVVSIIGPSSSNKFTLLQCVTTLGQVGSGEVIYLGEKATWTGEDGNAVYTKKEKVREIQSCYGLIFQNFNLFPHYSVTKNITDAPIRVQRRRKEDVYREAEGLLQKMGLEDKGRAYPYQLSGGQCQRVTIARALALNPKMLFFGEPTSALDPEPTEEVLKIIRPLADIHITMVIVTHEMVFARDISDRVIFMADGMIVEEGRPEEVFISTSERTKSFLGRHGDMLWAFYKDPCKFKNFM